MGPSVNPNQASSSSTRNRTGSHGTGGRVYLQVDDSTESEGGSSYHEWSDNGWRDSAPSRPSLSSSDDYPLSPITTTSKQTSPSPEINQQSQSIPIINTPTLASSSTNTRTVSFSHHGSTPHRRMTHTGRPSIHTAGSNVNLESLTPTTSTTNTQYNHHSSILNSGEVCSPGSVIPHQEPLSHSHSLHSLHSSTSSLNGFSGISGFSTIPINGNSGYSSPAPPYPGDGNYASSSSTHPRIRRKSISHVPVQAATESDTSADDPYLTSTKKKKPTKNRDGSFSFLPTTHRRRRASSAATNIYINWPRWLGGGPIPKKYQPHVNLGTSPLNHLPLPLPVAVSKKSGFLGFLLVLIIWLGIREWTKKYDLDIRVIPKYGKFSEYEPIQPLKGCFNTQNISPEYQSIISNTSTTKHQLLSPGIAMMRGQACYDFAATIQPTPVDQLKPLIYHTYWRADLLSFGDRQMATILAFLATQPLSHSKLILWTNGADKVRKSEHVKTLLSRWGNNIEVRQVDMPFLTKGTELEVVLGGSGGSGLFDERAWVDGDAVRLLVLWHYGGVWMDMDQILTRDLHPLTESEFVMQWDCFGEASPFHSYHPDQPYFILNGALMHFHRHSSYICEAFHIMASSPLPKPNTFTWGSHLYSRLHRRLLAARIQPFTVLPWCFADPRNCDWEVSFPDPFEPDPSSWLERSWDGKGVIGKSGKELLEERLGHVWTVHLHNQWGKAFPPNGWMERLINSYRKQVGMYFAEDKETMVIDGVRAKGGAVEDEDADEEDTYFMDNLTNNDNNDDDINENRETRTVYNDGLKKKDQIRIHREKEEEELKVIEAETRRAFEIAQAKESLIADLAF